MSTITGYVSFSSPNCRSTTYESLSHVIVALVGSSSTESAVGATKQELEAAVLKARREANDEKAAEVAAAKAQASEEALTRMAIARRAAEADKAEELWRGERKGRVEKHAHQTGGVGHGGGGGRRPSNNMMPEEEEMAYLIEEEADAAAHQEAIGQAPAAAATKEHQHSTSQYVELGADG